MLFCASSVQRPYGLPATQNKSHQGRGGQGQWIVKTFFPSPNIHYHQKSPFGWPTDKTSGTSIGSFCFYEHLSKQAVDDILRAFLPSGCLSNLNGWTFSMFLYLFCSTVESTDAVAVTIRLWISSPWQWRWAEDGTDGWTMARLDIWDDGTGGRWSRWPDSDDDGTEWTRWGPWT